MINILADELIRDVAKEGLHQRIARMAQIHADRPAIAHDGRLLTYRELQTAVVTLKRVLIDRGIAKGDVIAILISDSAEFIVSHLAVLGAGAVSMPLERDRKIPDLARFLIEMQCKAYLTRPEFAVLPREAFGSAEIIPQKISIEAIYQAPPGQESTLAPSIVPDENLTDANDVAAIIFSSGTGGPARAAELTHENVAHQVNALGRTLRIRASDKIFGDFSLASIFGLTLRVHLPLTHGAETVIESDRSATDWLSVIEKHEITVIAGTPRFYSDIAKMPEIEDSQPKHSVRFAISCGGRIPASVARTAEKRLGTPLLNGYGATEICGLATLNLFPNEESFGGAGETLGGIELAILDESGKRVATGKEGRIAVRGTSMMRGFKSSVGRKAHSLVDGWLLTDDIGILNEQSELAIICHETEYIVKGGFPIHASEVEDILLLHPQVEQAVVVGIPDQTYGEDVKAYLVLIRGSTTSANEIIEYARKHLKAYKCPRVVKFCKELPQAPNGRIYRGELKEDKSHS